MRRINNRTVELTDAELIVIEWFNDLLDRGHGIDDAVAIMRGRDVSEALRSGRPFTEAILADNDFIAYLTDDRGVNSRE